MKEVNVIYWSSTGNTQAMAEAVGAGVEEAGGKANVIEVSAADASMLKDADSFALGASAMGDAEMDDFVTAVEEICSGKTVGLFGSYDWGDGEWMRKWVDRMTAAGATVVNGEGLICQETPDDAMIEECKNLGKALAANA